MSVIDVLFKDPEAVQNAIDRRGWKRHFIHMSRPIGVLECIHKEAVRDAPARTKSTWRWVISTHDAYQNAPLGQVRASACLYAGEHLILRDVFITCDANAEETIQSLTAPIVTAASEEEVELGDEHPELRAGLFPPTVVNEFQEEARRAKAMPGSHFHFVRVDLSFSVSMRMIDVSMRKRAGYDASVPISALFCLLGDLVGDRYVGSTIVYACHEHTPYATSRMGAVSEASEDIIRHRSATYTPEYKIDGGRGTVVAIRVALLLFLAATRERLFEAIKKEVLTS